MDLVDLLMNPRKAVQRFSPLKNDLTEGQANELAFIFNRVREGEHRARIVGERSFASSDPVVRAVYGQDVASLPKNVDLLVKRKPGGVAVAKNKGELLELLRFCKANQLPITPRAGGTSGYGGAVPTEGGVVVELRAFNKVLDIDAAKQEARVQAGITWLDLEEALAAEGLATRCYPTSAPFATVGGWVAMGGGGVGSFQYGTIRESLVEATVLTPAGDVRTFRGEDLDLVESCEGTTGFILEVVLKVREKTEIVPVAAAFDTIEAASQYVNALAGTEVFSLHILGPAFIDLKQEAAGARQLPRNKFVVLTALHDTSAGAATERLQKLSEDNGGEWVKESAAQWEWDTRFQHVNFKRFGPGLVAAEAVCGRARLAEAWTAAERALKAPESAVWAVAISPDEIDLIGYVLADERMPNYPLAAGNSLAFIDAVKKKGGRAYSPGMLLAGESKAILGKARVKRLKAWKKEHDRAEIMNPGKVLPARVKGLPMVPITAALGPGEPPLKWMRGRFDHRRGSTAEPSNKALHSVMGRRLSPRLARLADDIYKCSRTGHTNRAGGLHREVRFETQLPRGIVRAAQALLEGAEPTEQFVSHALSLPCVPAYDALSQNGTPIFETIEAVREAAQAHAGLHPSVAALIEGLEAEGNVLGKPADKRGDWLPGATPSGSDTTTLLVAGDVAAYTRDKDAAAAFGALTGTGFSFTTLGAAETHAGTVPYRLGAFQTAAAQFGALTEAASKKLKGKLPSTVVCLSSEDADVLRRRAGDLSKGGETHWTPTVLSLAEALAELAADGRLTFSEEGEAASFTLVHSPFATEAEREATAKVLDAMPGIEVTEADLAGLMVPDLAFALLHPEQAKGYVEAVKARIDGPVVVACQDLAHVLSQAKMDVTTLPLLVSQRMVVREGAAPVAVAEEEEEEGLKEHDIPEGAFRVELVKENAAIPVHPDESILDAAEALGYEMPSDCRAGSCVTCSAKWEGTPPDQSEGQILSGEEQKTHVLTCIAKPKGPVKIWSGEQP